MNSNTDEYRKFDLFWLTEEQLEEFGKHHGPFDDFVTDTGINLFQQTACIGPIMRHHLHLPALQRVLVIMQQEGRTVFGLTPNFLGLCEEQGVTIPFVKIGPDTYPNNIFERLKSALSANGPESGRLASKERE